MRTFLWWLFVAAVCSPLALMLLLLAQARFPALDPITLRMPLALRSIPAELAFRSVGYGKESQPKLDRVLRLDPDSAEAWSRRCTTAVNAPHILAEDAMHDCRRAVELSGGYLDLNGLGLAQEEAKDFCAAEDSFTSANSRVNAAQPFILRNLGRAALECGHVASATASFEIAETKDAQQAAVAKAEGGDEQDEADARDDLRTDREWLIVTYGRQGRTPEAATMCGSAHPDWKACSCNQDAAAVKCTEVLPGSPLSRRR